MAERFPVGIWWLAWVCLASAIYIVPFVDRGWIPHDEGLLGQSAERVLGGELPHRDFDEVYTGGLSYLHALAFKIGGVRLLSVRWTLLAFVLLWVPLVFSIASRSARAPVSALITAAAVTWSVPNYFASLPSWYNLFFATGGIAALLRYLDTGRARWLFAAGLAGGCSFLVKSTALYYIAGAMLFLLIDEVNDSVEQSAARPSRVFVVSKSALAILIVGAVVWLVRSHTNPAAIAHFVVPIAAVSLFLVWSEIARGRRPVRPRVSRLVLRLAPFLVGVTLPIAGFLIPYAQSGAIGDFFRGVFITPARRLTSASAELPPWFMLMPMIPYAAVLLAPSLAPRIRWRATLVVALVAAAIFLFTYPGGSLGYQTLWSLGRHMNIAAVLGAVAVLLRLPASAPAAQRRGLLLLAAVTAFATLIEFPFAAPIYFCYTAPLVALTLGAVVDSGRAGPRLLHLAVAGALVVFAAARLNTGFIYALGVQAAAYEVAPSRLWKSDLRVPPSDRNDYYRLVSLILSHARGRYIYATPDCPEVYFLSGFANPTRTFYETFDPRPMTPRDVLALIERHGITVVVINLSPEFSRPIDRAIDAALAARFPLSTPVGRFLVRWSA